MQGYLRFDASRLRYRGQMRDAGDAQIMLINDQRAQQGELRLAVLDGEGITRTASLVFDVLSSGYASSIGLQVEEAGLNGSPITLTDVNVVRDVAIDRSLVVADAQR